MSAPHSSHTATLLPDGEILVLGGHGDLLPADGAGSQYYALLAEAEVYNPASGLWSVAAPMSSPRLSHTATLLGNGKVLVSGGWSDFNRVSATAELCEP